MTTANSPSDHQHQERTIDALSGWGPLIANLIVIVVAISLFVRSVMNESGPQAVIAVLLLVASIISMFGLIAVAPNSSRVLLLFGKYQGTIKSSGFHWVNPFYSKRRVSLRIRNFETGSSTKPELKNKEGVVTQPVVQTGA